MNKMSKREKAINVWMKRENYLFFQDSYGITHVVYYNLFERIIRKILKRKLR